jgi:hypothetical protein
MALASIFFVLAATANAQQNDFVTVEPEPQSYAWWLRTKFHPFETEVRGIPVGKIRATWCKASEFRKDLFPPDLRPELDGYRVTFSHDGFFDGSKTRQTALVGAYESCAGETGAFLLVLAWPRRGLPTIRFVQEISAEYPFAILQSPPAPDMIVLFYCLSCDHVSRFKWDKPKRRFELIPSPCG